MCQASTLPLGYGGSYGMVYIATKPTALVVAMIVLAYGQLNFQWALIAVTSTVHMFYSHSSCL